MKSSSSSRNSSFSRHFQFRWPTSRPLQLSTLILENFEHLIRDPKSRKTLLHWKITHNPKSPFKILTKTCHLLLFRQAQRINPKTNFKNQPSKRRWCKQPASKNSRNSENCPRSCET